MSRAALPRDPRAALVAAFLLATGAGRADGEGPETDAAPPPPSGDTLPVWPAKTWESKPARALALDPEKLAAFATRLGGRGCVVRHGCLAQTWGEATRRGDIASAVKPFFTHFLLQAVQEGRLANIDAPLRERLGALDGLNAALGHKDRRIRWRDLACQTSGYGVSEPPGAAFDYSDFNMALFADALFGKVFGLEWAKVDAELLRPALTEVLECEDAPSLLAFGVENRPGRLSISPRDLARFGLLYLRRGRWRERQVLRAELVELALKSPLPAALPRTRGKKAEMLAAQRSLGGGANQTDHIGSYSFAWWTNGVDRHGRRHWPRAPEDAVAALGHGGKRGLLILPSRDLIAAWNDAAIEGPEQENEVFALLAGAATP